MLLLGQRILLGKDDPVSLARDKFLAIHLLGIIYCVDVLYPLLSLRTEMEWKIGGKKWNTTD